jgi:hypothetical protein
MRCLLWMAGRRCHHRRGFRLGAVLIGAGLLAVVFASASCGGGTVTPTWTNIVPLTSPPAAAGPVAVYDSVNKQTILFGGYIAKTGKLAANNGSWQYDAKAAAWKDLKPGGTTPPAVSRVPMVFDTSLGKVLMRTESGPSASRVIGTWAYDSKANTWTDLKPTGTAPPVLGEAGMVYDASKRRALLFGGTGENLFAQVWGYDSKANAWTELKASGTAPSVRRGWSMAYDQAAKKVILFGGWSEGEGFLNDTWTFDPASNTWTNLKPAAAPPGRYLAAMAYDVGRKRVVLYGGLTKHIPSLVGAESYDFGQLGDVWTLDVGKKTWTSVEPAVSPPARGMASLTYDASTGKLVLFGGLGTDGLLADTWLLRL